MEWALNPIRHWLVTPKSFVSPLQEQIFQVGQHCRSKALWLGWCLSFSSGSMQSTFLCQEHQPVGMKALGKQQLNLSLFNELYRCDLQQWGHTVSL